MNKIFPPKIIFITLFLIFCSFNLTMAQNGVWSPKVDLAGSARSKSLSFSIGTKGYIGSGSNATIETMDLWEYDQVNGTWTQKANIGNVGRVNGVGFSIGNKGYAGLGLYNGQSKNDFWEYNPQNNTWTQKAFYPGTGKISAVGFSIGDFGYIGTGSSVSTIGNETKQFWQYNPADNSWTQKADFAGIARDRAVGFSIDSKGYIGTGYDYNGGNSTSLGDFWEYNPVTDLWTPKATVPELQRSNGVGFSTTSRGYIGLGYLDKTDFWQYNPESDSWAQVTTFSGEGRLFPTSFSIGNKGYVGMGYSFGPLGQLILYNDLWEYEEQLLGLVHNESQANIEIYPNPSTNFINVISNNTISQIIIFNLQGQEQLKSTFNTIDISSLASGVYFLKAINSEGAITKKIIKL